MAKNQFMLLLPNGGIGISGRTWDTCGAHATLQPNSGVDGQKTREFASVPPASRGSRVEIEYCTQCRWLLRAAWMAQELLTTFEDELDAVALKPGQGGAFEVRLDGETVWSRKQEGRFPDIKELKQRIRDRAAPGRTLGHTDKIHE